jgi:ribosomal protein L29
LIAPFDIAKDALAGKGLSLESNRQRRADMDAALGTMGADTDSFGYGAGKLVGEIAGTAGAGGAAANVLSKVPRLASAAPLLEAIRTGGMSANGAGMLTRATGGAIGGGISAGLINPEDAATGAVIGAAAPGVISLAGNLGKSIGEKAAATRAENIAKFNRGAPMRETLSQSIDAGYVVPPNMVNPSTKNAIIESFSGKQATSQIASVRNQDVTEKLVRQSLGLADDAPLSKSALEQIRKVEGGAYKRVGELSPASEYDLEALKTARNEAQGWFNAYNRSASPTDLAKAKDFRDTAEMLEMRLESHAKDAGKESLIPALREARKQIAKTYTVERALNDATGTVNAKVIGRMFDKGKPLSDGLDIVGRFASGFPNIAQAPQQMGSPAAHNLRSMASMLAGGGGLAAAGPMGLAAAALPFAAGPASRSLMFRQGTQQALANQSAPTLGRMGQMGGLLADPELQMLLARSAPATASLIDR